MPIIPYEKLVEHFKKKYIELPDEKWKVLIWGELPSILDAEFLTTEIDGQEVLINKWVILDALKAALEIKFKDKRYRFRDKKLEKTLKRFYKLLCKLLK